MTDRTSSDRFNRIAANFANSEVHRMSPTIQRLHEVVELEQSASVCDVACGAGQLALSFRARAARIVGVDPAPNMLAVFNRLAEEEKVPVESFEAASEDIPLPDNAFDLVMSRLAPHHFSQISKSVNEMVRLAKPGGSVAVIDLEGNPNPEIDELNHQLELLHDPTHVRSLIAARWRELFVNAGLTIEVLEANLSERPQGVTVTRWCEIASSGADAEARIRELIERSPEKCLESLGIRREGNEYLMPIRTLLIVGRKARA